MSSDFDMDLTPVTMIRMRAGALDAEVVRDFVPTIEAMQAEVGGHFEFVYRIDERALAGLLQRCGLRMQDIHPQKTGAHQLVLACNEEARIMEPPLPINAMASPLYAGLTWMIHGEPYNIRGDAILLEID